MLVDAIAAANWQLRLDLFHEQLRAGQADPAEVAKTEKLTSDTISRLRGKWSGTVYRLTFDNALNRALKDPRYRAQAVSDYDAEHSGGGWSFPDPSSLMPGIRPVITVISYGIVGVVGIFLVFFIVKLGFKVSDAPRAAPPQAPASDTYGSADFEEPRGGVPSREYIFEGVFFGKSSAPSPQHNAPFEIHQGAPIVSTPKHHTLLVAQTRTGKGSRVISPTLLRYLTGSAFVIDPKGENAAVTARARAKGFGGVGQKVHIVNPWGALGTTFQDLGFPSATYNPLDVLDRNDPNVVATAHSLAWAICPLEKHESNPFWGRSAAAILTAVLLYLTDREGLGGEVKNLARVREILTLPKKDFERNFLAPMAASQAFSGAIRENAGTFVGLADVTYSGIMQHVAEKTAFLSDPRTKASTSSSSFSMMDLINGLTTIYLVIPPTQMQSQVTWLRLMIASALSAFKQHGGRPGARCMFLIDELASLGNLRELPGDISLMAGYGVDFVLVVQGLNQLKDVYGDASGTIIGNCAYKWFCNVDDLQSAEYLSKVLGSKTVQTKSSSTSRGMSSGNMSSNESTNMGETGRPLLMPDEILHLGRDTAILLAPGDKPHYLRTVDYWDLPQAFAGLKQYYPHLYWEPPLTWDKNPLERVSR